MVGAIAAHEHRDLLVTMLKRLARATDPSRMAEREIIYFRNFSDFPQTEK